MMVMIMIIIREMKQVINNLFCILLYFSIRPDDGPLGPKDVIIVNRILLHDIVVFDGSFID